MTKLNALISSLRHNCTRDLAWAIFAPELIRHPTLTTLKPELDPQRIKWFKELDSNPEILIKELYKGYSLGRYYETLWAYFFQHDEQYNLIHKNLPVRDKTKTIGEFDFIIQDQMNHNFIHLEIAIKYYLLYQSHPSQSSKDKNNWLGPNSHDTLQKKWRKITQHQSQLTELPEARRLLYDLGIENIHKQFSLKGYLFAPLDSNVTPEEYINENTLYHWITKNSLLHSSSTKTLALIPKRRWLCAYHETNSIEITNKDTLLNQLKRVNTPLMAAYVNQTDEGFMETERFFIIPDSWP